MTRPGDREAVSSLSQGISMGVRGGGDVAALHLPAAWHRVARSGRDAMHEDFMRLAIAAARRSPLAPFGALLVDASTGEVVAEGVNRWRENPTWHGEIDAINRCASGRPGVAWSGLRLYTTAEPCCMCQGAILWAGIPEVVFGTSIRTLVRLGWRQIDIAAEEVVRRSDVSGCRITGGVLEAECDALFEAAGRR